MYGSSWKFSMSIFLARDISRLRKNKSVTQTELQTEIVHGRLIMKVRAIFVNSRVLKVVGKKKTFFLNFCNREKYFSPPSSKRRISLATAKNEVSDSTTYFFELFCMSRAGFCERHEECHAQNLSNVSRILKCAFLHP